MNIGQTAPERENAAEEIRKVLELELLKGHQKFMKDIFDETFHQEETKKTVEFIESKSKNDTTRQIEFIKKALKRENAVDEIKKILELELVLTFFGDSEIKKDGQLHSPLINGELIPAFIYSDGRKLYHNNGTKVDPVERMLEIIAEKLLEAKENKLAEVLKLLA